MRGPRLGFKTIIQGTAPCGLSMELSRWGRLSTSTGGFAFTFPAAGRACRPGMCPPGEPESWSPDFHAGPGQDPGGWGQGLRCEDSGGGHRSLSGQIQDGGTEHRPTPLAGQLSWPSMPGWSARPGARVHFRCVATGPSRLSKCKVLPSVASQCSPGSLQRQGQSSGLGLGSSLRWGTKPGVGMGSRC